MVWLALMKKTEQYLFWNSTDIASLRYLTIMVLDYHQLVVFLRVRRQYVLLQLFVIISNSLTNIANLMGTLHKIVRFFHPDHN